MIQIDLLVFNDHDWSFSVRGAFLSNDHCAFSGTSNNNSPDMTIPIFIISRNRQFGYFIHLARSDDDDSFRLDQKKEIQSSDGAMIQWNTDHALHKIFIQSIENIDLFIIPKQSTTIQDSYNMRKLFLFSKSNS